MLLCCGWIGLDRMSLAVDLRSRITAIFAFLVVPLTRERENPFFAGYTQISSKVIPNRKVNRQLLSVCACSDYPPMANVNQ